MIFRFAFFYLLFSFSKNFSISIFIFFIDLNRTFTFAMKFRNGRCFAIRRLASLLDRKRAIKRAERAYLAKRGTKEEEREEGGGS